MLGQGTPPPSRQVTADNGRASRQRLASSRGQGQRPAAPTIHPETHERPHALARAAQLAARRGHSAGQPGRAADCRDSVPPLSRQQPSHTEDRSRCNSAAAGKTDTDQQSANHAPNAPQPQVPAARNQRTSPSPIMLALHINHYSTSCCKTKKMSTMVDSCRTPYEHARNQEGT
jgi:hypothetical protein